MRNKWGITSLQRFIEDLDTETFSKLKFPNNTDHYDLYNFLFVNFNYTSLLDGYVYLDQEQFDPHPFIHADRNFEFFPNPADKPNGKSNAQTIWSSYVLTEVIHPHGQQSIPRSLLFGVDAQDTISPGTDDKKTLRKPYWGQNNVKFAGMFERTALFIIFGCSLGETDGWWWRRILDALASSESSSELIIYWWYPEGEPCPTKQSIREQFLTAAGYDGAGLQHNSIVEKIHVVPYHSNSVRTWLKTS